MRIGLIVEYEGTEFHGSQLQANARTVQGALEEALALLFSREVRPALASRTDAGVHATGQVAAFDIDTRLDGQTIRNALNHYLPDDLRVRHAQQVPDRFDPRRDAEGRHYVYVMSDAVIVSPLMRRMVAHVRGGLDEGVMADAAARMHGTHDFAAFAGPGAAAGACTVRRIDSSLVAREAEQVIITIEGNAFLHQQVRRTAAALADVGRGVMTPDRFEELVRHGKKGEAHQVLPPHGLRLEKITYPDTAGGALPLAAS